MRRNITSAFAGALLLGLGATAALAVTDEFSNMCAMGLASGKDIQTDCSVNAQLQGKTYCFGSKEVPIVLSGGARLRGTMPVPRRSHGSARCAPLIEFPEDDDGKLGGRRAQE